MSRKQKKRHFGKIKADPSKHAPHNSYCAPTEYEDIRFTCVDCGVEETWLAEQQRVYFEEWKQPIYHHNKPRRCRACRKARRANIAENNRKTAIGLRNKTKVPNKATHSSPDRSESK
ncbi:MAG: zinc-ribbon domain containing protein [Verrucomicrobiota bacterium]